MFLGPLLLRPDEQEPEHRHDQDQRHDHGEQVSPRAAGSLRKGL
jgi:hypothetical protein